MTTTINASPTNGLVQTADGSGILKVQSNGVTTNALAWGSYAYVAAGSTPTLRSSYNISSITRNSTGSYTFAFTNSVSDANYSVVTIPSFPSTQSMLSNVFSKTTTSFNIQTGYVTSTVGAMTNYDYGVDFSVFGN